MHKPFNNPSSNWYELLNRKLIVRTLETVQDLIVISLCIGLFSVMAIQLRAMFLSLLPILLILTLKQLLLPWQKTMVG